MEQLTLVLTSTVLVGAIVTAVAMSMIAWHTRTELRAERRSNRGRPQ